MTSKKTKAADLANAKLFYKQLQAQKSRSNDNNQDAVKTKPTPKLMKHRSPSRKQSSEKRGEANSPGKAASRATTSVPRIRKTSAKKATPKPQPSKRTTTTESNNKVRKAAYEEGLKYYRDLQRTKGKSYQDDDDDDESSDLSSLISESETYHHRAAKIAYKDAVDGERRRFDSTEDGVGEPKTNAELPTWQTTNLYWMVGVLVFLVALVFEDSVALAIEWVIDFLWSCSWKAVRAVAIVFILWIVVRLGPFAMTGQVRTANHKRFLQLRLDVSRTKARVYEVLRADPDTGVTVADLREDSSMAAAGTSHKYFRKIWSQVVNDIRLDGRVAKLGPWVHGSEEEEVWQWLGDATRRDRRGTERGLRRVVFD